MKAYFHDIHGNKSVRQAREVGELRAVEVFESHSQGNKSDEQVLALWLHGRSEQTKHAYSKEVQRFLEFVGKPLPLVTMGDLQVYLQKLENKSMATQARTLHCLKSLFNFAFRLGYLPFNVAAPITAPKVASQRAGRILPEWQVQMMIATEPNSRNRAILALLYAAGLRVSELCALKWRDLTDRTESGWGQLSVVGKGSKSRAILIPASVWQDLLGIRGSSGRNEPVFQSRKRSQTGGHLTPSYVRRIVQAAAKRVGIQAPVSPHFLRHSHATHALERGAPIHLVQQTLGHSSVATTGLYLHARPFDSSARYLSVPTSGTPPLNAPPGQGMILGSGFPSVLGDESL